MMTSATLEMHPRGVSEDPLEDRHAEECGV